jgi:hypothetical protein
VESVSEAVTARFGLLDEVAAVAFLVSDAGGYINGTELSVGGGQSA